MCRRLRGGLLSWKLVGESVQATLPVKIAHKVAWSMKGNIDVVKLFES